MELTGEVEYVLDKNLLTVFNIYMIASSLKLSSVQLRIEWFIEKLNKMAVRKIIGLLFLVVR